MSKFFEDLWESIFTPGPTPSLLIATNVTFACLQAVLFALLVATYSVHFVVLSLLCGGLWWAINWFANELELAKKEKAAREAEAEADQKRKDRRRAAVAAATAVEDDSDTELEVEKEKTTARGATKATGASVGASARPRKAPASAPGRTSSDAPEPVRERESTVVPESAPADDSQRTSASQPSGVSTEDEWEKVSDAGQESESK